MPAVTSLDPKKSVSALPYVQEGSLLPAVKPIPAQPTQADLQQGSNNVMGTAQNLSIQKATQPNQTMGLVESQVNKMIQQPELVPQGYVKNQIGQYDRNRADAMKAFQQTNADTANTGATREAAYNFAMQGAQGRSDLENQLNFEAAQKNREATVQALGLGMDKAKTASGLDTDAFNRLIAARGAFEGERAQSSDQGFQKEMSALDQAFKLKYLSADQSGQQALTELKGKIDKGMLLTEQDFKATQSSLDRALQTAMQSNDINAQRDITILKGQIDEQAATAQREWSTTERQSTQSWSMSERLSQNSYDRQMQILDQKHALSMQSNDINAQRNIEDIRGKLQLKMQTNDMDQQTKMAYLGSKLDEAKANNDVERQKNILSFQHTQEMSRLRVEFGQDRAMAYIQNQLATALQNNDHVNAMELQKTQLEFNATERAKDKQFEVLQQLAESGAITYDQLATGTLPPDIAKSLTMVDPVAAARNAIDIEYNNQLYQFSKTAPKEYLDANSASGLSQAGLEAYNKKFNETILGQAEVSVENILNGVIEDTALRGASDPTNKNNAAYTGMLAKTPEWKPDTWVDPQGMWKPDVGKFKNPPAQGEVIKMGNALYRVTSPVAEESKGENYQYFTVMNVDTGITQRVQAPNSGTFMERNPWLGAAGAIYTGITGK